MSKKLLRDDIEYIVHCDRGGNVIGPISKEHAHLNGVRTQLTHYSTWSMVYHWESGKYGIQRKNPQMKDEFSAGRWDMGVAGHNCYVREGDSFRFLDFEENLAKEAREEIGIDITMTKSQNEFIDLVHKTKTPSGFIFDKFLYKTEENNEWVGLGFIVVHDTTTEFIDNEVVDFQWLTLVELAQFLKENNNICSPLPLVFEKAEKFRTEILK
ncbi:MAG: hypothetical protein CR972_04795 [Candidatus Moraniibacteriota bacterium]|nr:MAG: hypothetical protein CR972_04795 [Candidatus Moranbacteria bacterium]